ncbi:Valine--tRNA ligase [Nitrospira tepida]|uniref:Valine--tRNA ligase n=1 Tax=Nitrospira tepida TaxID=2973512 RepID=A0AA86MZE0_9BACT|nr:valine--tRNA ligase [Nitrospira tepida]CAI4031782.1 Valine--tRNA ligase [Nitrospira tepida]
MSHRELPKTYDPHEVEQRWYEFWAGRGYFHARVDDPAQPYTIVIPPPNVTGSLHVGHALNNSLQDILIRWRRMQGRNTLWVPGMDHAGIATQNVVERQLAAEGLSRETLGREKFIERVWAWKEQSGGTILRQLRRLGASCDWERTRFTMDAGLSKAVREVFVRLHEDGLLYRGERLINWCPRCLTALSDIEVEHEETTGKLYTIRYPLADDPSRWLLVATTRPETMLGDTAVAVHPEDDRYKDLIGRQVALPLTSRTIPIVGDAILVDREFGTGAVKITPAHDFNDFEAGERHALPRIKLLDIHAHLKAGLLAEGAKADQGVIQAVGDLPVAKARPKIEQLLAERGLLEKVEPHKMALGKCYRCKTVVEPFLSDQWFVKIKPLARPAIDAVEQGDIQIIPEAWKNNYLGWMRDIKDWCISRQIWWGHQIPAWYCETCHGKSFIRRASDGVPVIPSDAVPLVGLSKPASCPKGHGGSLVQDPDVLDTWFSSALWPFSTLGWPDKTRDLEKYYPTSTLVTGLDILFFWVARMIMMGLKFMGEVPFREVYIHALVRDAEGQKMSKSKGNVIDPLHVMEQYGTDALRFTLASMSTPGRDIKLAEERIEGYRNFANKIWNAARFILMNLEGPRTATPAKERSLPDRWILARLSETIGSVSQSLEHYRFDQACSSLYQFVWHEYCDWYLELAKVALQQRDSPEAKATRQTLEESSEALMRLLHPFMPFLTEEIWQTLPHEGESVMIQSYPRPDPAWEDKEAEEALLLLQQAVSLVRTGRSLLNYSPAVQVAFFVECQQAGNTSALSRMTAYLSALAKGPAQVAASQGWPSEKLLQLTRQGTTIGLTVMGQVDLQKALARIAKQRDDEALERTRLEGKLKNQEFVAKAPPEVVAEHQQRLVLIQDNQAILDSSLTQLTNMLER